MIPSKERGCDDKMKITSYSFVALLLERDGKKFLRFQPHGYEYYIELPVITSGSREKTNAWTWNGDIEKPTLRPSIKTTHGGSNQVSHLWLNDGMCQHLADSTDGLAGRTLPLLCLEYDHDPVCNGNRRFPPMSGGSCSCYKHSTNH